MNLRYPAVARRAEHRCEYCRAPEAIFNFPLEVEHIIPLSREGANDLTNLALACRSCNLYKADYLTGTDPVTQNNPNLFHPRRDAWGQHFQADLETGTIRGMAEIERGTVARLEKTSIARCSWPHGSNGCAWVFSLKCRTAE